MRIFWRGGVGRRGAVTRRWWRRAGVGVIGAALVVTLGATAVNANVETQSWRHGYVLDGVANGKKLDNLYIGSFTKSNSDRPWFCIEFGVPITSAKKGSVVEKTTVAYRKAAYLISRYGDSTSKKTHVAIAMVVHDLLDDGSLWASYRKTLRVAVDSLGSSGTTARANRFRDEAEDAYGPWTLTRPRIALDADKHGGTVSNIALVSAAKKQQSEKVTLTLSGDATWESSGTRTTTVVSSKTASARFLLGSGGGSISVAASYADAPPGFAMVSTPPLNSQVHTTTAEPETLSARTTASVDEWSVTPQATSVATPTVSLGAALADTITVSLPEGQSWPTLDSGKAIPAVFRVDWYYSAVPVEPRSAVPDDAPVASSEVTVRGEGPVLATADHVAADPGYYYPVASFRVDEQEEAYQRYYASDWSAALYEKNEQTLVTWQPRVTTKTSQVRIDPGATLADHVTVSNNLATQALRVESTLWGPFSEPPSPTPNPRHAEDPTPVPDGAQAVGTVTTDVVGNVTATTPALEVTQPGYYVWTEKIAATPVTTAWNSDWAPTSEVSFRVYEPRVTTVASSSATSDGATLRDTLTVTGNDPNRELSIISTLYGPFSSAPENVPHPNPRSGVAALPDGRVPVIGHVTTTLVGNGTATSPGVDVTRAGYYVWVEVIAATDSTTAWAGDFGQAAETTYVPLPASISGTESAVLVATSAAATPYELPVAAILWGAGLICASVAAARLRRGRHPRP